MVEKGVTKSKDLELDLIKPLEKDNSQKERKTPPGTDLVVAVAFWLWGIMLSYFPIYASVPSDWTWPFRGVSYIFYGIGAVAAIFGLSNLTNSKFLQFAGTAFAFGMIAYLFHLWASSVNEFGWSLLLRSIVFLSAAAGLLYMLLGIPHLFRKSQQAVVSSLSDLESHEVLSKPEHSSPPRSRLEQIAGIIIAVLALLTALTPLIKAWFKIQD